MMSLNIRFRSFFFEKGVVCACTTTKKMTSSALVCRWLCLRHQSRLARVSRRWRDAVFACQRQCRVLRIDVGDAHEWIYNEHARDPIAARVGTSLRELTLHSRFPGCLNRLRKVTLDTTVVWLRTVTDRWLPQLTRLDMRSLNQQWKMNHLHRAVALQHASLPTELLSSDATDAKWHEKLSAHLRTWNGPLFADFTSFDALESLTISSAWPSNRLPLDGNQTLPNLHSLTINIPYNGWSSRRDDDIELAMFDFLEHVVAKRPALENVRINRDVHTWTSQRHGRTREFFGFPAPNGARWPSRVLTFKHHNVPVDRIHLISPDLAPEDPVFGTIEAYRPSHLMVEIDTVPVTCVQRWRTFPQHLFVATCPSPPPPPSKFTISKMMAVTDVHLSLPLPKRWSDIPFPPNVERVWISCWDKFHAETMQEVVTLSTPSPPSFKVFVNQIRVGVDR
jgi:hypothetical protein